MERKTKHLQPIGRQLGDSPICTVTVKGSSAVPWCGEAQIGHCVSQRVFQSQNNIH